MSERTSAEAYADRVTYLRTGTDGSNGTTKLDASSVQNDTTADTLSGTTDLDWFFQSAGDVLDAINGEVQTSIL